MQLSVKIQIGVLLVCSWSIDYSQNVRKMVRMRYNSADKMVILNKYLHILKKLNFSNINTQFSTTEIRNNVSVLSNNVVPSIREYQSRYTVSLVTPTGKEINVCSLGRNVSRELAEKEALANVINNLSKRCLHNGVNHVNNESNCALVLDGVNEWRKQSLSKDDLTESSIVQNTRNNFGVQRIDKSILKYQSLTAILNKRFYSQSSSSSGESGAPSCVPADLNKNDNDVDYFDFDKEHAETLRVFKAPRNFIGNIYNNVRVSLKMSEDLKSNSVRLTDDRLWLHTLTVNWPEKAVFTSLANTKKEACRRACVLCIEWLQKLGKVDNKGNLNLVDKEVLKNESKKPLAELKIDMSLIASAEELIRQYSDDNLEDKLIKQMQEWETRNLELCPDFNTDQGNNDSIPETLLMKRNKELYDRLQERKYAKSSQSNNLEGKLPITPYRDEITNLTQNNQVLVIKGEPGCGKSTQVPQYIIDDFTEKMKATDCNIIVTQPRRISAISLAERIASERQEMLADVVGYQVRLQSLKPRRERACILFCSTGILLRKMLYNPDLRGVSHVIIDEAHERDLNTDFMLLLAKRAAAKNPNLKIIIMSATINPELFQNYFMGAAVLHIPGFTHPVTPHFLDSELSRIIDMPENSSNKDFPVVDVNAVGNLVMWIDRNKPPGAVLVFLPGWSEIKKLQYELQYKPHSNKLLILPVHSRLSHMEQKKIFTTPPRGMRKVILATNIAETSITIDDVKYVIDTGVHKQERIDSSKGTLAVDNQWVSQASAAQRRGRAGRVGPGECYHLYTKEKFESFDTFPVPEVHRVRLETSVLNSKVYSGNEKAEDFLKQLPEPPSTLMIRDAVQKLQWAGALDERENLTPLGTRISVFTTHPFISKAIVHSYVFKCVNPMLTIGTLLSSDVDLFPGTMNNKAEVREIKSKFSSTSDHLSLALMFHQWESLNDDYSRGYNVKARRFADNCFASNEGLNLIRRIRHLVAEHLYQCGLLEDLDDYKNPYSDCNLYSENLELLKGVLLSGLSNVLVSRNWDIIKGVMKRKNVVVTESGQKATISPESVNHKRYVYPSPFMTYFGEVRSEQQRTVTIRETSIISPLTLILFQCATLNVSKIKDLDLYGESVSDRVVISVKSSKKKLNIMSDNRTAEAVVKLRHILWSLVGYLVREIGSPFDVALYNEVMKFNDKTLSLLDKMLREQIKHIDNEENSSY